MKKIYLIFILLFVTAISNSSYGCYATYRYVNSCAGNAVWFYAMDTYAVQAWDFGDGTPGNPNKAYSDTVSHVYANPGTYYVTHFVNIGAEWAFETQVITVGSTCFAAVFDAQCAGSNVFNFTDKSIGGSNITGYAWDFGDPSSGSNNFSTYANPNHNFSAPGTYTVMLVINGTQTDTAISSVTVSATCMSSYINYMLNPVFGDTTFFNYNFSNVTSASWDFGDPSSGSANYSSSFTPWHIFTSPGVFVGSVTYSNATDTKTVPVYTYVVDGNVWPGDANIDGVVSAEDILPIGLYYGSTGAVRSGASLNFSSQPIADWSASSFPLDYMYLTDMVNKKHADCNGDGIINAADIQAITQNLGMTHFAHNNLSSMQMVHPTDPHFLINAPATMTAGSGASVSLNLGDATVQAQSIYGYCTTIAYDNTAIVGSSVTVNFANSWLGPMNLLNWFYNDAANGLLTIVSVRNNQNSVSGYGEVATISFDVSPSYSGNIDFNLGGDTKIMSNVVMGGPGPGGVQRFIKANLDNASVQVILRVNENMLPDWLTVYPSPASDYIHVSLQKETKAVASLYDMAGRLVEQETFVQKNNTLDVSKLTGGMYHLNISAEGGNYNVKVLVR